MLFGRKNADKDEVVSDPHIDCLGGLYEYTIFKIKTGEDGQTKTDTVSHSRAAVADCLPMNQQAAVQARITTYRSGMREVLCPRYNNSEGSNSCNLSPNQRHKMSESALKMHVELDERIFGPKRTGGIQYEIIDTATRCHFAGKK